MTHATSLAAAGADRVVVLDNSEMGPVCQQGGEQCRVRRSS